MKPVEQRFCFDNQASRIERVRAPPEPAQPHDHVQKKVVIQQATRRDALRRRPSAAKTWLQAIALTARLEAQPHRLFADIVEDWAQRQPGRPALLSDGQSFTYGELAARINRYARWARDVGLQAGRTVCVLMPNRPDYLACWLGISSVGGTVALINTRLVGQSLAHCIDVAHADHLILAADCVDAFESSRPHLHREPQCWSLGTGDPSGDLDAALAAFEPRPLSSAERGDVTIDERALLIYTSGTTGLPKAANVSHRRILAWGGWFSGLRTRPSRIVSTIACRCITPWAASPLPAACSARAVRSRLRRSFPLAASGTTSNVSTAPSSSILVSFAAIC
ncbi:UNVERIFIED_ORG: acyl-CoA synthetase (AMP-forming)/AMP-acid ligase II [Bradyrhizobium japonicum]